MVTRKSRSTKQEVEATKSDAIEASLAIRSKALVFISHDSRDADIAEAFANLLSDVSAGTLKSFRSSDKKGSTGIEFGAEWYTSIMSQLGDATDVVALLTARSIDRPWILYEAGVARGKLDTTVLGLALGVPLEKISTGPFGQFQNCGDDEDSLTKLVMQLLQRNPDAAPREEAVRMQVRLFIQSLSSILAAKPKKPASEAANEDQNVAKLFEEVKAMVRELPQKVDAQVRIVSRRTATSRNLMRYGPKMLEEIFHRMAKGPGVDAKEVRLLVILSFIKDDVPWLYEVGMQIYRSMSLGDREQVVSVHRQIHMTLELMLSHPVGRELYQDEESYMMLRYIPEFIDRIVFEYLEAEPRRRRITRVAESPKGSKT